MNINAFVITSLLLAICLLEGSVASKRHRKRKHRAKLCTSGKNRYYEPQLDKCRRCDKCVIGKGQIPIQEFELKLDPVHGALSCLPCRTCSIGYYSSKREYKCRPCKNCSQLGLFELRPCNSRSDSICGDPITEYNFITPYNVTEKLLEIPIKEHSTIAENDQGSWTIVLVALGVGIAVLLSCSGFVYFWCKRRQNESITPSIINEKTSPAPDTLARFVALNNRVADSSHDKRSIQNHQYLTGYHETEVKIADHENSKKANSYAEKTETLTVPISLPYSVRLDVVDVGTTLTYNSDSGMGSYQ